MGEKCLQPLYPGLIGSDWHTLDPRLQRFYSAAGERRGAGLFQIHHGSSKRARALAWILRLPEEGRDVQTRLKVNDVNDPARGNQPGELWTRTFRKRELSSFQFANQNGLLAERFQLTELWFRLEAVKHSLVFVTVGGALVIGPIRIRLPLRLCPEVRARASGSDENHERFDVSVSLRVPLFGLVLAYEGYIDPEVANL
jgi:uncharacterized protein DUF4166